METTGASGAVWHPGSTDRQGGVVLRIDEVVQSGKVTLSLTGVLDAEAIAEVRLALQGVGEATLDLSQLRRVDREGIVFLISVMRDGFGLMGVPCYVQTWLLREMKT